jgi:hypothetical protein
MEIHEDPASTYGREPEYIAAWNEKYGASKPSGNASKAEWVDYAVKYHGVSQDEAEAMTATDLKDTYGEGPATVPGTQDVAGPMGTAEADAASGTAAPGAGVNSGTPGGSAATTGTSSEGAKAKA